MSEESEEVFSGKSFKNLLEDIYNNSKKKEAQIQILITELKPMIKNIGDAIIIVPLIKDYMEIAVKNDEALIKMAAIVQKAQSRVSSRGSDGLLLTEQEKRQLMEEVEKVEYKIAGLFPDGEGYDKIPLEDRVIIPIKLPAEFDTSTLQDCMVAAATKHNESRRAKKQGKIFKKGTSD